MAFARGDRTGVLITRVPFPAKTSSNAEVNLPSRSRIRNLNRPVRCQYSFTAADLRRIEPVDAVISYLRRYHRGPEASPKGCGGVLRLHNCQCEDYARRGSDTAEVTDRVHRSSGSRAPTPARLLDHLPGYGDDLSIMV